MKQIIINLLSNAIKYNKANGTVIVRCEVKESDRIRIIVNDTGAGLVPDKIAQLFQPFNRLGQEASGVAGTGIGLVVTKQLVELMDGVIGVESSVDVGSQFWVELRSTAAPDLRVEQSKQNAPYLPPSPKNLVQSSLLYIEDNPAQ